MKEKNMNTGNTKQQARERLAIRLAMEHTRRQTAEDMRQLEIDALRQKVKEIDICNAILLERCERAERRVAQLLEACTAAFRQYAEMGCECPTETTGHTPDCVVGLLDDAIYHAHKS